MACSDPDMAVPSATAAASGGTCITRNGRRDASGIGSSVWTHCVSTSRGGCTAEPRGTLRNLPPPSKETLWQLAKAKQNIHRFSTLITAQQVRDHLGTDEGIDAAIDWCKKTGVTKVYIETFRSDYLAPRETLQRAKERFLAAGFDVSGCVTTTIVGKKSTGWNIISCYTDPATQDHLREIFEYTAELFDEIMIDDFWFTDCQCSECDTARQSKTVTIGDKTYPVAGDTWEDYRCELMVQLSRDRVLAPAKRVNPKATLIIKYPQWYDRFHERGYEVVRETADFDRIWVGTETRDYDDARWGGTPQYEAYFIMRWLGGIGGEKCGGGWFDPYGTTEKTYVEQARQTVLAGAKESLLFCYGSLLKDTGPANVQALRPCIPELLQVAEEVSQRQVVGVAAYKPPNSHPEKEPRVFDFVGMMGVPLVPCHEFPKDAKAAFFSVHALKDPNLSEKLSNLIARGVPILVTDGLAQRLEGRRAARCSERPRFAGQGRSEVALGAAAGRSGCHPAAAAEAVGPHLQSPEPSGTLPVRRWELGGRELP